MALDLALSPEHDALRETVRRHGAEEIAPLVREAEERESFPKQLFSRWAELGLLAALDPQHLTEPFAMSAQLV